MDFIYHYTSIDTLKLILKNRTIRFNRLDKVDDLREHAALNKYNLGKYVFVSCWTDKEIENIPLWSMYAGGMTGVRLKLKKDIISYKPLKAPESWEDTFIEEGATAPLNFEDFFGDNYMISPTINNRSNFHRNIEYVSNLDEIYNGIIQNIGLNERNPYRIKLRLGDIAGYKDEEWKFQNEFRFVIVIFPAIKLPPGGFINKEISDNYTSYMMEKILKGVPPPMEYFDITLSQKVLDKIQVKMGPKTSDSDYKRVKNILDNYTKTGKLSRSKFLIQ